MTQLGVALAADFDEEGVKIDMKNSCGHGWSLHQVNGRCFECDHQRHPGVEIHLIGRHRRD